MFATCTVPAGVDAPTARDIGSTYMMLEWTLPSSPNGVFTGFTLYQSSTVTLYSGALTSFNVTNLAVCTSPLSLYHSLGAFHGAIAVPSVTRCRCRRRCCCRGHRCAGGARQYRWRHLVNGPNIFSNASCFKIII